MKRELTVIFQINNTTDVYLVTQEGDPVSIALTTGVWPDECRERKEESVAPALNLSVHPSTREALLKHCETTPLPVSNKEISGNRICETDECSTESVRLFYRVCETDEYSTESVRLTNILQCL